MRVFFKRGFSPVHIVEAVHFPLSCRPTASIGDTKMNTAKFALARPVLLGDGRHGHRVQFSDGMFIFHKYHTDANDHLALLRRLGFVTVSCRLRAWGFKAPFVGLVHF